MLEHEDTNRQDRIEQEERMEKATEAVIRFLQLSLQLFFQWGFSSFTFLEPIKQFITYEKPESHFLVLRSHMESEEPQVDMYTTIVQPLCLIWTLYNIFLLIAIKCIDEMSKFYLIATGVVNYTIAIFIVVLGFIDGSLDNNAGKEIYHRYAPFQVMNCLTVVSLFYFTNASQPRRFSTSPGNFVWVWLFVAWKWSKDIEGYMIWIGVSYAIISITSVMMLLLQLMRGLTTSIKKIIISQWAFSLVLTALTEIFAIVSHNLINVLAESQSSEKIEDDIAVSLLEIFMIVNILDMFFWTTGRCIM